MATARSAPPWPDLAGWRLTAGVETAMVGARGCGRRWSEWRRWRRRRGWRRRWGWQRRWIGVRVADPAAPEVVPATGGGSGPPAARSSEDCRGGSSELAGRRRGPHGDGSAEPTARAAAASARRRLVVAVRRQLAGGVGRWPTTSVAGVAADSGGDRARWPWREEARYWW